MRLNLKHQLIKIQLQQGKIQPNQLKKKQPKPLHQLQRLLLIKTAGLISGIKKIRNEKNFEKVLLIIMCIIISFCFASCSNNTSSENKTSSKTIIKLYQSRKLILFLIQLQKHQQNQVKILKKDCEILCKSQWFQNGCEF